MLSEESERFFMEPLSSPLAAPSRPSVLASGLWYLGASSAAAVLGYCRASFSVTDLRFMTLSLSLVALFLYIRVKSLLRIMYGFMIPGLLPHTNIPNSEGSISLHGIHWKYHRIFFFSCMSCCFLVLEYPCAHRISFSGLTISVRTSNPTFLGRYHSSYNA